MSRESPLYLIQASSGAPQKNRPSENWTDAAQAKGNKTYNMYAQMTMRENVPNPVKEYKFQNVPRQTQVLLGLSDEIPKTNWDYLFTQPQGTMTTDRGVWNT